MPRPKVLVTGATGFAGAYLRDLLVKEGFEVFGTSFPDQPAPGDKKIFHLDLRLEGKTDEIIRELRPRRVFHLAAVSQVKKSWDKRRETLETNLMGTFFLLEAIRKCGLGARILYVSSSEVYGRCFGGQSLGEKRALEVVNPYAFTKAAAELLCRFYAKAEGLDIVIARPFQHTGPGQSPDFVCSDWARQIALIEKGRMKPVIKVGNLEVRRDFGDVRDVVCAYVRLMERGRGGEVYNISTGRAVFLRKILDTLLSFSTCSIRVEIDPKKLRKIDLPLLRGNNRKIRQEVSWKPVIPLKKTLKDLLDYWRGQ